MAKKNNKEKLTYKQMLSYMDFMNAKMVNKFQDLDNVINGLGYFLRSYVEFKKDDKKFQDFLIKKEEKVKKEMEKLGSETPAKSEKEQNQ
tara:strand:- start:106 stop:375 length:270 start_codon:yes stop_codon:yes gene_type:complete